MYQNYSQFTTRFSTLGENWLLNILHGIWTFKHNYGSPIKLLLRRTKIVFPPEFSNVQKNCYDGDGIKIPRARYIFWKFAENWGKFRQRLTFPAFSLPQHYGERRWWPYFCQKGNWGLFCQLPSCFHTLQDTSNNENMLEVSWLMVTDTLKYICSHVFLLNPQSVF